MKLTRPCSQCGKPLELIERTEIQNEGLLCTYKCGHVFMETPATEERIGENLLKLDSVLGDKQARGYQEEGVKFILKSNFNCIIGDQMRLGKTPQALLALASAEGKRFPALILVRSANLWQWIHEYKTWTNLLPNGIFPIVGSTSFIPPGFSSYIMSMDTLSKKGMVEKLLKFGFKLVIADEAHSFKNPNSKRSQALIAFLHEISIVEETIEVTFSCFNCNHLWTEKLTQKVTLEQKTQFKSAYCPNCNAHVTTRTTKDQLPERNCGVILLTGTPIKNRAEEFFVPLNIVAPTVFPTLNSFRRNWLEQDEKGKWSRIHRYKQESFKDIIKPFFLRREKEDVYTDLPALNRMYTVIEVQDQALKNAYNATLDKMEREASERSNYTFFDSIGDLIILRKICGLAKAQYVAEYAQEMLDESADQKLAIGIHHHDVRNKIEWNLKLEGISSWSLTGSDSAEEKYRKMVKFETAPEQVITINSLAGGVGMDFHYINTALIVERQWSPADDEQFEFRFYNPDKSIKTASTNIEYVLAKGTLDQWWHEMLLQKYQIYGETIGTNWDPRNDPKSWKELLNETLQGRL